MSNNTILSDAHKHMLKVESAITPEVITARGYRTVTAEDARQYGFTGRQARDGLLIPVHTTEGAIGGHVLRPDNPRVYTPRGAKKDPITGDKEQKVVKYEWPKKMDSRIDCPPSCFAQLKDPDVPLWVTEGQKKGDALASWGLCVIDLPNGVWGWKSKQTGVLADLDYIVWSRRLVYIIFDSDVITKPQVAKALARLTKVLSRRGAKVVTVPLPQEGDDKLGVDDFKARGGTLTQLLSFAALGELLPLKTDGRLEIEAESAEYLNALRQLGYEFRMRSIDDTLEVNGRPISDPLRAVIRTRMRDQGFKNTANVEDAYLAWAFLHQYHPVQDHLSRLRWNGKGNIATLAGYFCDDHKEDFEKHFPDKEHAGYGVFYWWLRRWMIGAVAKVFDARQNIMLVLDGPQGCGKSHFVRWLGSMLPEYYIEAPLNPDDKDCWLRLITKLVWEIGELGASTRKSDREALKNFVSTQIVTLRKAYGKYDTIKPAMASLIGTINNEAGFLTDPTGNRRFLVCRITEIDWEYERVVDVEQVWAEAVALYEQQEPWLPTPAEQVLQNDINSNKYMVMSPLKLMFDQYYEVKPEVELWTPAMQIITRLETLGLRGSQMQHLKELATIMRDRGVSKGRPAGLPGRPVSYKGVYTRG